MVIPTPTSPAEIVLEKYAFLKSFHLGLLMEVKKA